MKTKVRIFEVFGASRSTTAIAVLLFSIFLGVTAWTEAAPSKTAQVTRIIKDVRLIPQQAAPRAASLSDQVNNGTALRTGSDSRAELTFPDLTITRLGANTLFSFDQGTRELNLAGGTVLVEVPPGGAPAHVTSAACTAGITGGTALFQVSKAGPAKLLIMEGKGHFCSKRYPGECEDVHPGEMSTASVDGHISKPEKFNVALVYKTSKLIKDFKPLANEPLIMAVIDQQQAEMEGAGVNPLPESDLDKIDQSTAAVDLTAGATPGPPPPTPPPTPPPVGTPSKFGQPVLITAPNPYVITAGTQIQTDPSITTNGVTDFGKVWRGLAVDGPLSAFVFGMTTPWDTFSGFDKVGPDGGTGAVFKFTALQLTGDPAISTTNGEINLALVALNNITSGLPGKALTFNGLRGLILASQQGSITLGPEVSLSGLDDVLLYTRSPASEISVGAAINARKIEMQSAGAIRVDGVETTQSTSTNTAHVRLLSGRTTGVAIQISDSAQLLALLNSVGAGPSGTVEIRASAPNNTANSSSINVQGKVHADGGVVDIRHEGDGGTVNLFSSADLHADIVKVSALGPNGTLNIGGSNAIAADSVLKLYATGSNGTLNFLANCTLKSPQTILAANTININQGVVVTISSSRPADVFTNKANYVGFGGGVPVGGPAGTFGGAGAKNPQPLANAPPLGPSDGP